jgi:hypothetical protein
VAYTPEECDAALEKTNPLTIETATVGVELAQKWRKATQQAGGGLIIGWSLGRVQPAPQR